MATRSELFGAFEVTVEGSRLKAVARAEKVDRSRHAPADEVKGAIRTSWDQWRLPCSFARMKSRR
jgi:hypothetical protein